MSSLLEEAQRNQQAIQLQQPLEDGLPPVSVVEDAADGSSLLDTAKQFRPDPSVALENAYGTNPEQNERNRKLSEESGLPVEAVEANPALIDTAIQRQKINDRLTDAPVTSKFLEDPTNAKVAHDDVFSMATFENYFSQLWKDVTQVDDAFMEGVSQTQQADIGFQRLGAEIGILDPVTKERLAELQKLEEGAQSSGETFIGDALIESARQLPIMGRTIASAFGFGAAGAGTGAVVGSVVPGAGTVAGAGAGFGIGAKTGSAVAAFELEAGLAFNEFASIQDKDGVFLDRDIASGAAIAVGTANAALELFSLNILLKTVPGGQKLLGYASRKAMKEALQSKTVRQALGAVMKRYAQAAVAEGATEAAQEIMNLLGAQIAKIVQGGNFEEITAEEFWGRVLESAEAGFKASLGLGLPGSVITATRDTQRIKKAEAHHTKVTELLAKAKEIALQERSPELFQQYLGALAEDADRTATSVSIGPMVEYLQDQGVDPVEFFGELGVEEADLAMALDTGTDVDVDLATAVTRLSDSDHIDEFVLNIRDEPEGMTMAEAKLTEQAFGDRVKKAADDIKTELEGTNPSALKQIETEAAAVAKDFREQAIAAKALPANARNVAAMVENVYITEAAERLREGKDPLDVQELYKSFGLTISNERGAGQAALSQDDFINNVNNVIDITSKLKAGEKPDVAAVADFMKSLDSVTDILKTGQPDDPFVIRGLQEIDRIQKTLDRNDPAEITRQLENLRDVLTSGQPFPANDLNQDRPGTPAFDAWFGDGAVVDENGQALPVFHATFNEFDTFQIDDNQLGIHMGDKETAEHRFEVKKREEDMFGRGSENLGPERLMEVYTNIQNPLRFDENRTGGWRSADFVIEMRNRITGRFSDQPVPPELNLTPAEKEFFLEEDFKFEGDTYNYVDMTDAELSDFLRKWLGSKGFDGIVYKNSFEGSGTDSYIAFFRTQIKSVNNRGTYDLNDPNILHQQAQGTTLQSLIDAMQGQAQPLFQLPKAADITPEQKKALDRYIESRPDAKDIRAQLEKHKSTPWADQAIYGALTRQHIEDLIAGRPVDYESALSNPRFPKAAEAAAQGAEGLWAYVETNSMIGNASKPVNAVNSTFLNCRPSIGCAKFCYATKGNYRYDNTVFKAEIVNWAIEVDPARAAQLTARQYKATAEFHTGKALRLMDKGDLGPEWVPFIAELNKQGVRTQVFSKRPEILRQISDFNLRLLSVDDSTSQQMARDNPDLNMALVYSGQQDISFIEEYADRIQVILPVKIGRKVMDQSEIKPIPKDMKKYLCPVDGFGKKVGKTQDGLWNCTRCDKNAGVGCFHGKATSTVMANLEKDIQNEPDDLNKRLEELTEFADTLEGDERQLLLGRVGLLVSALRRGADLEKEEGVIAADEEASELFQTAQDGRQADLNPLGFYSNVVRSVESFAGKATKGSNWLSIIKKGDGPTQKEMDTIVGLEEMLNSVTGKIAKEDVLAFIKQNGLDLQEVVLATDQQFDAKMEEMRFELFRMEADLALVATRRDELEDTLDSDHAALIANYEISEPFVAQDGTERVQVSDPDGNNIGTFSNRERAEQRAVRHEILVQTKPLSDEMTALSDSIEAQRRDMRNAEIDHEANGFSPHQFGTPEEQEAATKRLEDAKDVFWRTPSDSPEYAAVAQEMADAEAAMIDIVPGWGRAEGAIDGSPKFTQYTMNGEKTNQREFYLTLPKPDKPSDAVVAKYQGEWDAILEAMDAMDRKGSPEYQALIEQQDALHAKMMAETGIGNRKIEDWLVDSFHRIDDDVADNRLVVRIRVNDRIVDGKRVLFIEEIQADRQQRAGEKGGFANDVERVTELPEGVTVEETLLSGTPVFRVLTAAGNPLSGQWYNRQAAINSVLNAMNDAAVGDRPPPIPWAEDSEWGRLSMKRILFRAAQEGYDSIAWTPAEVQIDRYNERLRQNVDLIEYEPQLNFNARPLGNAEGKFIARFMAGPTDSGNRAKDEVFETRAEADAHIKWANDSPTYWRITASKNGVEKISERWNEDQMGKHIGKGMTKHIVGEKGKAGKLEGEGLTIGGAGMQQFYGDPRVKSEDGKMIMKGALTGIADKIANKFGVKTDIMQIDTQANIASVISNTEMARSFNRGQEYMDGLINFDELMEANPDKSPTKQQDVWHLDITEEMRETFQSEGFSLFTGGEKGPLGSFSSADPNNLQIKLFEGQDLSTLLHESGHMFVFMLEKMSALPGASQRIQDNYKAMLDWVGAESAADLNLNINGEAARQKQEKLAEAFEAYLKEGKAPSTKLKAAFAQFAQWLKQIYTKFRNLGTEIDPEISQIFDRMLATDAQIAEMKAINNFDAGAAPEIVDLMTAEERSQWTENTAAADELARNENARIQNESELLAQQDVWLSELEKVKAEVEDGLWKRPQYRAFWYLTRGVFKDEPTPPNFTNRRLSTKDLLAAGMTKEEIDALPKHRKNIHTNDKEDATPPDVLAPFLGFETGTELITVLSTMLPAAEAIELEANLIMESRHPSPIKDGTLEELTEEALYNEERRQAIQVELNALARKTGNAKESRAVINAIVEQVIADRPLSELLRPAKYMQAAIRAAAASAKAAAKGDFQTAFFEKRKQMMNHELLRRSLKAKKQVETDLNKLRKLNRRGKHGNIDADYLDIIRDILENYQIGPALSAPRRAKLESEAFAQWIKDAAKNDGAILQIPQEIIDADGRTHYKTLSLTEFEGLVATVKNVEKQGILKKSGMRADEQKTIDEAIGQMEVRMSTLKQTGRAARKAVNKEAWYDPALSFIASADAAMLKTEFLLEFMDGGPTGPAQQYIFQPFVDAEHAENELTLKFSEGFAAALDALPKKVKKQLNKVRHNEHLNGTYSGSQLLHIALNAGNASNLTKMLDGSSKDILEGGNPPLTEEGVMAMLQELTAEEINFVNTVWGLFEGMRKEVGEVSRKEDGEAPVWIDPMETKLPNGTLTGGYIPMMYDPGRSAGAAAIENKSALEMMSSEVTKATVFSGMKHQRTGFSAPVLLDLTRIPGELQKTAHFITHYDAVRQANKLIADGRFRKMVVNKFGQEYYSILESWVGQVATGSRGKLRFDVIGDLTEHLRSNATVAIMGASVTTTLTQPLGVFTAVDTLARGVDGKVKPGRGAFRMAQGLMSMFVPGATNQAVAKSKELKFRRENSDRDIKHALKGLKGIKGKKAQAQRLLLMSIPAVQFYTVDVPTWIAAYNMALEEMGSEKAAEFADATMRKTQGAGSAKDLSAVLATRGTSRAVTMFMTFFNTLYNIQRRLGREAEWSLDFTYKLVMGSMVMYVLPSMLEGVFRLEGPDPDDDEDTYAKWLAIKSAMFAGSSIPIARDFVSGIGSIYGYDPTPLSGAGESVVRVWNEASKLVEDEDAELTPAMAKVMIALMGYATGVVPSNQMNRAIRAWEKLQEEDADDFNYWQFFVGPDKRGK